MTPATEHLRQTLDVVGDFRFDDTTLSEVARYLHQRFGINVVVDVVAIGETGATPTGIKVTVESRGTTVANMLDQLAYAYRLGIAIHNDALFITSESRAMEMLWVRVYDVSDLVQFRQRNGGYKKDFDTLIDTITSTIVPDSWDDVGGDASIQSFPSENRGLLVISQTYSIHMRIENFLDVTRRLLGRPNVLRESVSVRESNRAVRYANQPRRRIAVGGVRPSIHE